MRSGALTQKHFLPASYAPFARGSGHFESNPLNVRIQQLWPVGQVKHSTTKRVFLVSAFTLIGMQFIPIEPHQKSDVSPGSVRVSGIDRQVGAIFERSCRDCHSSDTRWPWYSHVAPISW